jgi:hypothetical protein
MTLFRTAFVLVLILSGGCAGSGGDDSLYALPLEQGTLAFRVVDGFEANEYKLRASPPDITVVRITASKTANDQHGVLVTVLDRRFSPVPYELEGEQGQHALDLLRRVRLASDDIVVARIDESDDRSVLRIESERRYDGALNQEAYISFRDGIYVVVSADANSGGSPSTMTASAERKQVFDTVLDSLSYE